MMRFNWLIVRHEIERNFVMGDPMSWLLIKSQQLFSTRIAKTAHEYNPDSRLECEKLQTKRSRLLYQSKKRGILENDILLGKFAEKMLDKMDLKQLMRYDEIINGQYMEWDLYYYVSGRKPLPNDLKDCDVFRMLQEFVRNEVKEKCAEPK